MKILLLALFVFAIKPFLVFADSPENKWNNSIGMMTGVTFPEEIICLTEEVFHCGFDTNKCNGGINNYPKHYSNQKFHINFKTKSVIFDKDTKQVEPDGEIQYLGETTYLIKLKRYPNAVGYITTFSYNEKEVVMTWHAPYTIRPAMQAHSGRCIVVEK